MKFHVIFIILLLLIISFSLSKTKNKISLQWSICDSDPQIVLRKLGKNISDPDKLDPISYYDTNTPIYTSQGLMFRTKIRASREISLVKIRFSKKFSNVPNNAVCLWTAMVIKQLMFVKCNLLWVEQKYKSDVAYQTITKHLKNCGIILCNQQESITMRLFHILGYHLNIKC